MELNFAAALRTLNGTGSAPAAVRIANQARPTADYLFATILPEQNRPTYDAKAGNMIVRATMAGLVGMDSPYPPTGTAEMSTFSEQTAKIANHPYLPESAIRHLQQMLQSMGQAGTGGTIDLATEALNFLNKVVIQPHIDTAEYLRSEALVGGAIDWTFGNMRLQVSYGVPAGNFLANRGGTDFYGGSTSKFWADMASLRSILKQNVRAFIASRNTIDMILANAANAVEVRSQNDNLFTVRRYVSLAGNTVPSSDARETITLIAYDREGEILDVTQPGKTVRVPFMPDGKILAIGNNVQDGYRPGQGSTDDPALNQALGYTHIGPTVEGNNVPGRWARLFTPELMQMQLHGQGVSNILPVLETPSKIAVASTNMS